MLIPSFAHAAISAETSLSRRVNANSQHNRIVRQFVHKLIKKGEC